jgi:endonuclease III
MGCCAAAACSLPAASSGRSRAAEAPSARPAIAKARRRVLRDSTEYLDTTARIAGLKKRTRESLESKKKRASEVFRRLRKAYPDAKCALDHSSPLELLVATVLSAQCTDVRVNMVTPVLFRKYKTAADYARSPAGELEREIRQTGFFNSKARSLRRAGAAIAAEHGGKVPDTMDALVALPGVGRKTANVILGNAFGKDEGFVVDTHVARLSKRLGFTRETDPIKVEQDLIALVPRGKRTLGAHCLIFHGRRICVARKPRCEICPVNPLCPKVGVA